MAPQQNPAPGTVGEEWESELSREWEEPGEFLAGMRRQSRTGMESFFREQHELDHIISASSPQNAPGNLEAQGCDAEEE